MCDPHPASGFEMTSRQKTKFRMIDRDIFEVIKRKHGQYASWALWTDSSGRPKDNVGDLSFFDLEKNNRVLGLLHSTFVLVGLNISRKVQEPLGNFHDKRSHSMDYKLRYALKGTPLWGSYMTDFIKDFEQKVSGKVMSYLSQNKDLEEKNVEILRVELNDLGFRRPTFVAFGGDVHKVIVRNLGEEFDIWKLPHYSKRISKENYRKEVQVILNAKLNMSSRSMASTLGS